MPPWSFLSPLLLDLAIVDLGCIQQCSCFELGCLTTIKSCHCGVPKYALQWFLSLPAPCMPLSFASSFSSEVFGSLGSFSFFFASLGAASGASLGASLSLTWVTISLLSFLSSATGPSGGWAYGLGTVQSCQTMTLYDNIL